MKLSGLKLLRKKYKFTQEELAKKVGATGRSVTRWEQGHSFPKGKKLDRLMEIFGCKLDDLINGNPSNEVTADDRT
jgi:transcriptional regulator with XRE-family HTH domain